MYRSPLRLIPDILLPEDITAARRLLQLEKRKLMAEFELAGTPTINLHGQEVHRQDIVTLFDELGNQERLAYHYAIWQDKTLLHFLETGSIPPDAQWASNPLYDEAGFGHFVSLYFAQACNTLMQRALSGKAGTGELQALQANGSLLQPDHTEQAYRYVSRFFTEKKNELLGFHYRAENGEEVSITELSGWCTDEQIHLLNRLPDTFAGLRYVLANTLNNICVIYDQKQKNKLALAAVERAATIRVEDEELNRLIPSNLNIIRSKVSRGFFNVNPNTGKKEPKIGWIIGIILIIIRIAGCLLKDDDTPTYHGINDIPNATEFKIPHQKPQVLTYHSLLKGLRPDIAINYSDTAYGRANVRLRQPLMPGDNIFNGISLSGFGADSLATDGNVSLMTVRNHTEYGANLIYLLGDAKISSVYVPPGGTHTFAYDGLELSAQVYAGKDWSDTVRHSLTNYITEYYSNKHILYGGYRHTIAIAQATDTTGEPMFSRLSESNAPQRDTIDLNVGPFGIKMNYLLGERR